MNNEEIVITKLTPANGGWITQVGDVINNRVFTKELFVGLNDSVSNWEEVDDGYKDAWEEACRERKAKEEADYLKLQNENL